MRVRVYEVGASPPQPEVYLKLEESGEGVFVIACDSEGNAKAAGFLLRFNKDGTVLLEKHVGTELGFHLAAEGQIKVRR